LSARIVRRTSDQNVIAALVVLVAAVVAVSVGVPASAPAGPAPF
jgi:hypothetical protein